MIHSAAPSRTALRRLRLPALFAVLCLTTGCMATGQNAGPTAQGFGPTVAFESVDGPPPQVFERLVRALEAESGTGGRSFSVVPREASASYRIRSYLSAQVRRGRTTIAWVWDVYGPDRERALRLSGEEPAAGRSGRDAWAVADDQIMRRIAQAGLSGVSQLIDGSAPAQGAPAAQPAGPAIARNDDAAPEPAAAPRRAVLAFGADQ
jgi:hypothetical protein